MTVTSIVDHKSVTLDDLSAKAKTVHEAVVKTDENQMGFTRTEVLKINNSLWQYECAIHAFAVQKGISKAEEAHKNLDDDVRKNVDRAFVMVQRRLENCFIEAQSIFDSI